MQYQELVTYWNTFFEEILEYSYLRFGFASFVETPNYDFASAVAFYLQKNLFSAGLSCTICDLTGNINPLASILESFQIPIPAYPYKEINEKNSEEALQHLSKKTSIFIEEASYSLQKKLYGVPPQGCILINPPLDNRECFAFLDALFEKLSLIHKQNAITTKFWICIDEDHKNSSYTLLFKLAKIRDRRVAVHVFPHPNLHIIKALLNICYEDKKENYKEIAEKAEHIVKVFEQKASSSLTKTEWEKYLDLIPLLKAALKSQTPPPQQQHDIPQLIEEYAWSYLEKVLPSDHNLAQLLSQRYAVSTHLPLSSFTALPEALETWAERHFWPLSHIPERALCLALAYGNSGYFSLAIQILEEALSFPLSQHQEHLIKYQLLHLANEGYLSHPQKHKWIKNIREYALAVHDHNLLEQVASLEKSHEHFLIALSQPNTLLLHQVSFWRTLIGGWNTVEEREQVLENPASVSIILSTPLDAPEAFWREILPHVSKLSNCHEFFRIIARFFLHVYELENITIEGAEPLGIYSFSRLHLSRSHSENKLHEFWDKNVSSDLTRTLIPFQQPKVWRIDRVTENQILITRPTQLAFRLSFKTQEQALALRQEAEQHKTFLWHALNFLFATHREIYARQKVHYMWRIFQDFSKRRMLQAQNLTEKLIEEQSILRKLQQELEIKTAHEKELLREAAKKEELQNIAALALSVTHAIATPLQVVLMSLDELKEEGFLQDSEILNNSIKSLQTIEKTIRELQKFSKFVESHNVKKIEIENFINLSDSTKTNNKKE